MNMRTALQITLAVAAGGVILVAVPGGDARSPGVAVKAADGDGWRLSIASTIGTLLVLAWLAFWMVMAWRAVRALESMAASLRRRAGPPPDEQPPAAE
jgi:hypothetical protein